MWLQGDGEVVRQEPEIRYVDRVVEVERIVEVPVKQPNWHFTHGFLTGAILWQMFSTFIRYLLTN
jgi:hypothetical protein